MNSRCVIAVDGPSGAGKSTVARELARRLDVRYIDTGAMYRAAALAAERAGVDLQDAAAMDRFLAGLEIRQRMRAAAVVTLLGDEDVSAAIRHEDMGLAASRISALPAVRNRLTALQQDMGRQGGVVLEGRDIGTVVFPNADFKFFLVATPEERARRRYKELKEKGESVDFAQVLADIGRRDHQDETRDVAPLKRAPDAIDIDSTDRNVDEVVEAMLALVRAGESRRKINLGQGDTVLGNGNDGNDGIDKNLEKMEEKVAEVAQAEGSRPETKDETTRTPGRTEVRPERGRGPGGGPEREEEEGEDFGAMFEESLKQRETEHLTEIIKGFVVGVHKDQVMVDIGGKSEGYVPLDEFRVDGGEPVVNVGSEIEVVIDRRDEDDGMIRLSKDKAGKRRTWDDLEIAFKDNEPVTGKIVEKVKGGLMVELGVKAFLPGSQADIRPLRNLEKLLGLEDRFQIIKFNRRRGNVVVSRRVVMEREQSDKRGETLAHLEKDQVVKGVVKNITDYGAFIDLGGIDGLLHITDMSYGRITNPSEIMKVGDTLTVKILKFNRETEKVSLGLKQILPDPWDNVEKKYPVGTIVMGKVVSVTDYGAFVELERGVEGLVHVSEMNWAKKRIHPSKIVKPTDTLEAKVLDIDRLNRRISLSLKQALPNPWDQLEYKYPVGSRIEGKVRNITNFGVFVGVEEGIDGLVHISDLSWTKRVKHPSELFKKGQDVNCVVLKIDKDHERFSLGIKQANPDPWDLVPSKYRPGDDVKGKVVNITDFGVFVELEEGIEGLIHISELSHEKVKDPGEMVQENQEITAEILNIDITERKIRLSIKARERAEDQATYRTYQKQEGDGTSKLGELIQDKLSKVKFADADEGRQKKSASEPEPASSEGASDVSRDAAPEPSASEGASDVSRDVASEPAAPVESASEASAEPGPSSNEPPSESAPAEEETKPPESGEGAGS
jgi:small subunit ribosomal protein S1